MPSMEVNVDVDNTKKILRDLDTAMQIALEEIGLVAEGYAKKKCAVDTGYLRNSITHGVSGSPFGNTWTDDARTKGGSVSGTIGADSDHFAFIGTNVEYAAYVEYGTSRMDPQPFIKPAVENHKSEYVDIIRSKLENT